MQENFATFFFKMQKKIKTFLKMQLFWILINMCARKFTKIVAGCKKFNDFLIMYAKNLRKKYCMIKKAKTSFLM